MTSYRPTTLERAYQLAREGRCRTVGDIKQALQSEGFERIQDALYGPTLSADLRKLTDLLLDPERIALVHGDFAIVDDKNITTTRVGATYDSGSLPWLSKARWFMADHPLLFAFIVLLACLLLGALLYRPLRAVLPRRAAKIAPLA